MENKPKFRIGRSEALESPNAEHAEKDSADDGLEVSAIQFFRAWPNGCTFPYLGIWMLR
jgi:hypothetical protein